MTLVSQVKCIFQRCPGVPADPDTGKKISVAMVFTFVFMILFTGQLNVMKQK